ncbi:MAG: Ig-like domain-containing protein, partial [Bifidobacteriaceae bacterium]|nr:Ig-like domain-containing protein [Bifidobacteriaceae bacterium]
MAFAVALTCTIGTGTVAVVVGPEAPAEAADGTVSLVPDFSCDSLYEAKNSNAGGVYRWGDPESAASRVGPIYTPGTGWTTNQIDTMAIGPLTGGAAATVAYHWNWDAAPAAGIPVKRVQAGSTDATEIIVPRALGTTDMSWSGGEMLQKTAEIVFSGRQGTRVRNNGAGSYRMMVYNPATNTSRRATALAPRSTSDWLGASATQDWQPASDMAVDADGNAYLVVGAATKYLIKVIPGADNAVWVWEKVLELTIAAGGGGTDFTGMAFVQGGLYLYNGTGNRLWKIDTLSGQMTPGQAVPGARVHDLASCQTAPVVQGTVFNDANGDGTVSEAEGVVPGQVVEIYDRDGTYKGEQTTTSTGHFNFIVNRVATDADFYVRLRQPRVDGINAAQTYARADAGTGGGNPIAPLCATAGGNYQPLAASGVCQGARGDRRDPSTRPSGALTSDTGLLGAKGAGIVTKVTMVNDQVTAQVDFGVTASASHGDAPYKTTLTTGQDNGPSHIQGSVYGGEVFLGTAHEANTATPGPTDPTSTVDPHATTDDGVHIEMTAGSGQWSPLKDQILAVGQSYELRVQVGGTQAANAKVQGWGGALYAGQAPTAANAFTGQTITWRNNGAVTNGYVYGTLTTNNVGTGVPAGAPPTWARFRVSVNGSLSATDISPYPPTPGTTQADTNPWWVPGEVEDYRLFVTSGTLKLRARSTGGTGTFGFTLANIASATPSSTSDSIQTVTGGAWAQSGTGHSFQTVGQPVTVTASSIAAGFNLSDMTCADAGGAAITVTRNGAVVTIPASAVVQGANITCDASFAREIGPDSTFAVTPAGPLTAAPTTTYTATVTTKYGDGTAIPGVDVRFALDPTTGATIDPALANGRHCQTDANGTCSVKITGTKAGAYKITAQALNPGTTGGWIQIGTQETRTFTFNPATCTPTLATAPAGSQPAGSTFTGTITLNDANSNPCTGLTVSGTSPQLAATSVTGVTLGQIAERTGSPGLYDFTITSTVAGAKALTASYTPTGGQSVTATGSVTFTPTDNWTAALTIDPASATAVAGQSLTAKVALRDNYGNPRDGTVTITTDAPGAPATGWVLTTLGGNAQQAFTTDKANAPGQTYTVRASATVGTITNTATPVPVTFTAGPPCTGPVTSTIVRGVTGNVLADGTAAQTAIVTVNDCKGNPVAGAPVAFHNTGVGTFTGGNTTDLAGVTGQNGQVTASVTSRAVTGNALVWAGFGLVGGSATTTIPDATTPAQPLVLSLGFIAGTVSAGDFEVRTSGDKVADGAATHEIWVRLSDAAGAPVAGQGGALALSLTPKQQGGTVNDLGTGAITVTESTATAGLYVVTVTSTKAQTYTVAGIWANAVRLTLR